MRVLMDLFTSRNLRHWKNHKYDPLPTPTKPLRMQRMSAILTREMKKLGVRSTFVMYVRGNGDTYKNGDWVIKNRNA